MRASSGKQIIRRNVKTQCIKFLLYDLDPHRHQRINLNNGDNQLNNNKKLLTLQKKLLKSRKSKMAIYNKAASFLT